MQCSGLIMSIGQLNTRHHPACCTIFLAPFHFLLHTESMSHQEKVPQAPIPHANLLNLHSFLPPFIFFISHILLLTLDPMLSLILLSLLWIWWYLFLLLSKYHLSKFKFLCYSKQIKLPLPYIFFHRNHSTSSPFKNTKYWLHYSFHSLAKSLLSKLHFPY